jgi:hypothetical protein
MKGLPEGVGAKYAGSLGAGAEGNGGIRAPVPAVGSGSLSGW